MELFFERSCYRKFVCGEQCVTMSIPLIPHSSSRIFSLQHWTLVAHSGPSDNYLLIVLKSKYTNS